MKTMMKFDIHKGLRLFAAALLMLAAACSTDDGVDNREKDYGYVQFRLYKQGTRAALNMLADAGKIRVLMDYNGHEFSQTMTLSSSDEAENASEWGLRSEKLQLLAGTYTVKGYTLYDIEDNEVAYGDPEAGRETFDIVAGGLTPYDFSAEVAPRGHIRFRLIKDIVGTRADDSRERQYTMDEISKVDIVLQDASINNHFERFNGLSPKFTLEFPEEEHEFGYRTSWSVCDTLLSIPAGTYRLYSYKTYDRYNRELETNASPKETTYTIGDNETLEADVPVTLYETDEYIKDYYALKAIWEALDGENWYYAGEDFPAGVTWNFNKDVDLWGDQPGVTLHSNGRVATIDISNFGFRGALPPEIGQLTDMVSLYLGSHNDTNLLEYDPTLDKSSGLSLRERHMAYARMIHTPTQLSEPLARSFRERNVSIPEVELYEHYSEDEIIDRRSGTQIRRPQLYDVLYGRLCNGLTEIPEEIGNCTKLETFFVANSTVAKLPDVFDRFEALTDLEVYNCPNMTEFPVELAKLPNLVSANLSNNRQWSADEVRKGVEALADGESGEKIQILYLRSNNLEELPAEALKKMKKIGLLDVADNKIEGVVGPFGNEFAPVQLYLDNNRITGLAGSDEEPFCNYADIETFSVTYNKLTELPDIFSARSRFVMSSVDFSNNDIAAVANGENCRGIKVETLSLAGNRLEKFPKELFDCGSVIGTLNLRGNMINEIPEKSFSGSNCYMLSTVDLSYNRLTELPEDLSGITLPYLYGLDVSYNRFASFPYEPLYCPYLTALAIRGQRDADGNRTLREWPEGVANHKGLRALYIGSNDLRTITDEISYLIYFLDISDNPNIKFDASGICYYYQLGMYFLLYDKTQNIIGCDIMLQ